MSRQRRKARSAHISHERWLVSYADFITLLLAFFVLLYASSNLDKQKIARLAAAIHSAFHELDAFPGDTSKPYKAVPSDPQLQPQSLPPELEQLMKSELATRSHIAEIDVEKVRRELQEALGSEIKHGEIELRVTPLGFIISLNELGFFGSGEARLLPSAVWKLTRITRILNEHDFDIRVEGHTDNRPVHKLQYRSNWELSTARATEVVRLLIEQFEVDPTRISIAGYGEYHPIASNDTSEGRQMNRRVDLVLLPHITPSETALAEKQPAK